MTKERVMYRGHIYVRDPESKYPSKRRYFIRKTQTGVFTLHREIYKDTYGPIPLDCLIHHVNGDVSDNRPENLEAVPEALHQRTFHKNRKMASTLEKTCLHCGEKFRAKMRKSRFCDKCGSNTQIYRMYPAGACTS